MTTAANKQILYYGATNYAASNLDKYIEMTGEPLAIIKDSKWDNYLGDTMCGKYPVISFDEAIKQYPDAEIWFTYREVGGVPNELAKKFPPERMRFLEANVEYRKGCHYLGTFLNYHENWFYPCCSSAFMPVQTKGSVGERIAHYNEYVKGVLQDIREDKPNACSKCRFLLPGFYKKNPELETFCLPTRHPGDVCNFKCSYCYFATVKEEYKNKKGDTTYDILKYLSEQKEYDRSNFTIMIANGEICANKDCDKVFDLMLKSKWKAIIYSNLSIYSESFAKFMDTGRVDHIITSLDAGTPETFKKIKGLDVFDKVVNNIKKYPMHKTTLYLKYIFLEGINDNIKDVDGFYKIVQETGCKHLMINSDNGKPLTPKIKDLIVRLLKKAKADNLDVTGSGSTYLCDNDAEFLTSTWEKIKKGESVPQYQEESFEDDVAPAPCKIEKTEGKGISVYIKGNNNDIKIILSPSAEE